MNSTINAIVTIAVAIVGLATLAVLVSKQANTTGVISAAGNAFSGSIGAAVSPITGGQFGGGVTFNSGLPAI